MVMTYVGDAAEARPIHEANLARQRHIHGDASYEVAQELKQLAVIENILGNHEAAEAKFLEALVLFRGLGDRGETNLAKTLLDFGSMLRMLDRGDEEEPMLLEVLAIQERRVGKMHPDYAGVLNNLGNHYFASGDLKTARRYMEEHVELQRELNGEDSVPYGVALVNYASLLRIEDESSRALELLIVALDIYAKGYGTDAPRYAYLLENTANTMTDLGRYQEAEAMYAEALAILGNRFGTDHAEYAFTQRNWGVSLGRMGRPAAAVPELRAAIDIWTASHGANYTRTVTTRISLAQNLLASGDLDGAEAEATIALEAAREIFPEDDLQRLLATRVAASANCEQKKFAVADPLFEEALVIAGNLANASLTETVTTEIEYARSLAAQGRGADGRRMLERRDSELAALPEPEPELRSRIAETLATI